MRHPCSIKKDEHGISKPYSKERTLCLLILPDRFAALRFFRCKGVNGDVPSINALRQSGPRPVDIGPISNLFASMRRGTEPPLR